MPSFIANPNGFADAPYRCAEWVLATAAQTVDGGEEIKDNYFFQSPKIG
jgi:hypothetical protein